MRRDMTHTFVHGSKDKAGDVWEVYRDDSFLASGRWVVFKNGRRWVGCATEDEARDEVRRRCDE